MFPASRGTVQWTGKKGWVCRRADGGRDHEGDAPGGDWQAGHPPGDFEEQGLQAAAEARPRLCFCLRLDD